MTRLLIAAHGTRSPAGLAQLGELTDAVAAACPSVPVELCYLDVLGPRLADALADGRPTVVVPALLSTGYHVRADIPAVIADRGVTVSRHLGPDPLLAEALADRLGPFDADGVLLVASGSTDRAAAADREAAADLLGTLLDRPVEAVTIGAELARPGRVAVATYLLAEGFFAERIRRDAAAAGITAVSAPLGAHPAVVQLIRRRYEEAVNRLP